MRYKILIYIALNIFLSLNAFAKESPDFQINKILNGFAKYSSIVQESPISKNFYIISRFEGKAWKIVNDKYEKETFLDIKNRLRNEDYADYEEGLLDIAFPRNFKEIKKIYVSYTIPRKNTDGNILIISRFGISNDLKKVILETEEILFKLEKNTNAHQAGQLEFSPKDNFLYIGIGSVAGEYNKDEDNALAQDLSNLWGKIIRIDVGNHNENYKIPKDNPFINNKNAKKEIWSYGLRNPAKSSMHFDYLTGDLYITDTGDSFWEEINFQKNSSTGGHNYGYPMTEGTHCTISKNSIPCFKSKIDWPVIEYSQGLGGCSVVGGGIYRGKNKNLNNAYVFTDWCNGEIFGLKKINNIWHGAQLFNYIDGLHPHSMASINGTIYLSNRSNGDIFKLNLDNEKKEIFWKEAIPMFSSAAFGSFYELEEIKKSTSWKLTKPLRWVINKIKNLLN